MSECRKYKGPLMALSCFKGQKYSIFHYAQQIFFKKKKIIHKRKITQHQGLSYQLENVDLSFVSINHIL